MLWYFNPVEPSAEPTHLYYPDGVVPDPKYNGAGLANSVPVWMTVQTGENTSGIDRFSKAFGASQLQKITNGSITLMPYGQKGFPFAPGMVAIWSADARLGVYSGQTDFWILGFVDLLAESISIELSIGTGGGTFRLLISGKVSAAIPWDASADVFRDALVAMQIFQSSEITVTRTNKWVITFKGRWRCLDVPKFEVDKSGLTGPGVPTVTITRSPKLPFDTSTENKAGWWAWFYSGNLEDQYEEYSHLALYGAGPDEGGFDPMLGGKFRRYLVRDDAEPDGLPAEIEVSPWFP